MAYNYFVVSTHCCFMIKQKLIQEHQLQKKINDKKKQMEVVQYRFGANEPPKAKYQWNQFDKLEEDNMLELASDVQQKVGMQHRRIGTQARKMMKKTTQIQDYQRALDQLRSQTKVFRKPFEQQRLNLSLMQFIKMLKQAIEKDKDIVNALRKVGCKTRMRVRNKVATKEMFKVMLQYIEEGTIPEWMQDKHAQLLQKDDSKFQMYMRMDDNDL